VGRLAAIPTVVAIKLPLLQSGDIAFDIADFRQAAPTLSIGYSGDWGCKEALLAGADGWYSVAAGLFPAQASALTAAAMKGDRDQADRHDAGFATLWELFRAHGSLRLTYAVANMLGLTDAQPPRPLLGADENLRKQLASVLSTVELILQIRIAVSFTLHFATVATKFRPD
jgi:4-hydroxy-tetrahydrodipicolinate synthase|tara:strand:+ start:48908 stop:49420 length:513 start_codon:yes stop_codon:yes gene_type:complete